MVFFFKRKKGEKPPDTQPPENTQANIIPPETLKLDEKEAESKKSIFSQDNIKSDVVAQELPEEGANKKNLIILEKEQSGKGDEQPQKKDLTNEEIPIEEDNKTDEKKGFFSRLKERLKKTKDGVFNKVKQIIRLKGKIDEELLEEIEQILIQADVGVDTTLKIIDSIRNSETAREKKDSNLLIEEFKKAILDILRKDERLLQLSESPPTVILVVGVNGTGKTTTIGKLAKNFRNSGKKVMIVAGDTFRAAAVEQLEIWAKRSGAEFVSQAMGADPASVCFDALNSAKKKKIDIVLIDTAGRLHTKVNLMEELKKVVRVIKKIIPEAPQESLLILDATTGQNAISQAKIFSEAVSISGIVMTKLDGTAKGGILIAIRDQFNIPILKIGIGEQVNDLRDFNPVEFVDALFEE